MNTDSEKNIECDVTKTKGFGWKVSLSILGAVGWLVFLVLFLFFYAGGLYWTQVFAVVLLSLLLVGIVIGGPWAVWAWKHEPESLRYKNMKGFQWRIWFSIVVALGLLLFLIYWFWYQGENWNVFQNIAIFIVALLIIGGVVGAVWAPWGIRNKENLEKQ